MAGSPARTPPKAPAPRPQGGAARSPGRSPGRSIVWLASYPKSGNTWLRIFLANYIFNPPRPVPINQVHRIGMGDSVAKAYRMVAEARGAGAYDTADVDATLRLRPAVLRSVTNNGAEINFLKTHNQNTAIHGVDLIPRALTRAAIYVMRDPRDMLISYARHYGHDLATAAVATASPLNYVIGDATTVTQWLGSWSDHVRGWTGARGYPVLVLRYEDMQADPEAAFAKVLKLIGLPVDPARLTRAVGFSSFDELKKQETEGGFIERSQFSDRFFHTGTTGQWQGRLSPAVLAEVEAAHGPVMRLHGYL